MEKNTLSILPISSLFFAIGFLAIGYGMILTYIGVYLKESGSDDLVIGIVNAAFFLGAIAAAILSQKIISSVGHIRSFAVFASLMIIGFLGHALYFGEVLWAFLRFLSGFAYYGLLIILESWLNEKSPQGHRSKILAVYTIIFYLALAVGQLTLNIDTDNSGVIFIIGSILVLFSVIFISMTKIKEPVLQPFEKYSLPKIFGIAPLALAGSFSAGIFASGFFTMIPVYIISIFHSFKTVSVFMSAAIIGALISQWPIGMLSDKIGRRKMIAFGAFFTAAISLVFMLLPQKDIYFYMSGMLLGIGVFCLYPLSVARANDVVSEDNNIVEISTTLLFAYGMGSFISPLLIGAGSYFFDNFIFLLFCMLGIFLGFFALSKDKIPKENLSVFVNMPAVSGGALQESKNT